MTLVSPGKENLDVCLPVLRTSLAVLSKGLLLCFARYLVIIKVL